MERRTELLERGNHTWSSDSIRMILTPSRTAKSLYFYTQEVGYFKTEYPYYSERQNLISSGSGRSGGSLPFTRKKT